MSSFVTTGMVPGVYIDEVQMPGPIAGVGTSTAAFIGPAMRGPLNTPTFLTNWTQFLKKFGDAEDLKNTYITTPNMVYVTHAVRGFFENGGASCFFVRVGTAVRAWRTLNDRGTGANQHKTLIVTAKEEGVEGNAMTVEVQNASIVASIAAVRAQATLSDGSNKQATVTLSADAAKFKSGDIVFLEQIPAAGPTISERATIVSVNGATINFLSNLNNAYTGGTIRIADLNVSQTKIRVAATNTIDVGTHISIQQVNSREQLVVQLVDRVNNFIELKSPGLVNSYSMVDTAASVDIQIAAARVQATLLSASNNQATVDSGLHAANFRPGDTVFLEQVPAAGPTISERASIESISSATIKFVTNLTKIYTGGTIRIADLQNGQKKFRAGSTTGIEPGTCISLTQGANAPEYAVVQSVEHTNKLITLAQGITGNYSMAIIGAPVNLQTLEFTLIVTKSGSGSEAFQNLSMDPRHSRYFMNVVDSESVDVTLADPPSPNLPPTNRPAIISAPLAGGHDDDITQIQTTHYTTAIDALQRVDEINILCIPDKTDQQVQQYMVEHCQRMKDRFAILDPQQNTTSDPTTSPGSIGLQRSQVGSDKGYAAIYYPRIFIDDPLGNGLIKVPPSGHIAGVYARTDQAKGVHKAPANEQIVGVRALEQTLTEDEMGPLNEEGINVVRSFPGRGVIVWGARTTSPKDSTQWRYVNIRRLLLYIEESIQEGTRFAVFEPNNLELWEKVKRQVTGFLTRVWRDGALFGATSKEAFQVRVDEELNPPEVRALGQLVIEVIVYPVPPAEFIVFRVIQQPGGKSVQE
ncbi:MAG TPA: phage tail sheath subtilisin-like domain-containing protein [candidate division Zixibacteria bacterium]|nr:phage tail sheath subtilisin-like domain-containing protein [candidate division Zixibacteria bacterium]